MANTKHKRISNRRRIFRPNDLNPLRNVTRRTTIFRRMRLGPSYLLTLHNSFLSKARQRYQRTRQGTFILHHTRHLRFASTNRRTHRTSQHRSSQRNRQLIRRNNFRTRNFGIFRGTLARTSTNRINTINTRHILNVNTTISMVGRRS